MTLEEKREIIIKNKDPALAALESVTDRIYDLTDELLNDKGRIMTAKIGNYKAEEFIKELRQDAERYEKVRQKLLFGDLNLSLAEINQVALAFYFCILNLTDQINSMQKAKEMSVEIVQNLMSPEDLAKAIATDERAALIDMTSNVESES